MFGIVRRKSHSQLVRRELGQSAEHFKQAATHAAQGTGATVGPKFYAARDRVQPAAGRVKDVASTGWGSTLAALAPLAAAATEGTRKVGKAGKDTRKAATKNKNKAQKASTKAVSRKPRGAKKSKFSTLLLAGAAVGAVGAYAVRRRNSQQWDSYDPSRPLDSTQATASSTGRDDIGFEPAEPAGTAAFVTPEPLAEKPSVTFSDPTVPLVVDERADQTSSALHSPNVARMAGGGNSTT